MRLPHGENIFTGVLDMQKGVEAGLFRTSEFLSWIQVCRRINTATDSLRRRGANICFFSHSSPNIADDYDKTNLAISGYIHVDEGDVQIRKDKADALQHRHSQHLILSGNQSCCLFMGVWPDDCLLQTATSPNRGMLNIDRTIVLADCTMRLSGAVPPDDPLREKLRTQGVTVSTSEDIR